MPPLLFAVRSELARRRQHLLDEMLDEYERSAGPLPEEGAAALFLASDDAGFLTGVGLDVDGGRSIG